jgi:tryptophan 2,3-dioxygenase
MAEIKLVRSIGPAARMFLHVRRVTRQALMMHMPTRVLIELDPKERIRFLDGNMETRGFQASRVERTEIERRRWGDKNTTLLEFTGGSGLSIAIELDADGMAELRKAVES